MAVLRLRHSPLITPDRRTRTSSSRSSKSIFFKVRASWQEVAGVVIFSAIPFTAVKAIANSSLGEQLRFRLDQTKKSALKEAAALKVLSRQARQVRSLLAWKLVLAREAYQSGDISYWYHTVRSLLAWKLVLAREAYQSGDISYCPWYGPDRPRWLGPIPYNYPPHLTGEFAGDYGFDVAGLGRDPIDFQKYFNFEILHARWAMLAALGVVIPELLDLLGIVHFVEPVWWKVGYAKLQGDTLDYLGIPGLRIAGSQGVIVIAICQVLLMVGPEYARYCGIEALEPLGIYLPGDINYPGGALFDPLGLSKDPFSFEELKVKEIKNGRLAMVAWLGFYLQAALTGKGPLQNLVEHVSDPFNNNIVTNLLK